MMKKLLSAFLCLSLFFALGISAVAVSEGFIIDGENLIVDETSLELLAQEIYDKYAVAVTFISTPDNQGLTGAELSGNLYSQYISIPDGILLLDCREYPTYYMHYAGKALDIFAQGDGNAMMSAYDQSATYDEAVRAYLETADAVLAEKLSVGTRDLVLLDDLSNENAAAVHESESELQLFALDDVQNSANQSAQPAVPAIPEQRQLPLVVDTAGIIDPVSLSALNDRASQLSEKYGADVALVYVATTGGKSIQAFTDDFYDCNGYGYGETKSGIMLCIAVQDRKFALSTYGPAAYTFSDYGQYYMDEAYLPYMRNNEWSDAGKAYFDVCEELMEYERVNGRPYDIYVEEAGSSIGGRIIISLAAGFVLAFIPVASMRRKMLNVRKKTDARDYEQDGSFHLTRKHDHYITSTITKVPKPKPSDDIRSGGGGGGSSFHVSSSGRSHGGHSGSF